MSIELPFLLYVLFEYLKRKDDLGLKLGVFIKVLVLEW